jgi:hypothetical protein
MPCLLSSLLCTQPSRRHPVIHLKGPQFLVSRCRLKQASNRKMQRVARWNEECTTPSMAMPPNQPARRSAVSRTLTAGWATSQAKPTRAITARYHSQEAPAGNDRWANSCDKNPQPVKQPVRSISMIVDFGGDNVASIGKEHEEPYVGRTRINKPQAPLKRSIFAVGA